MIIRDNFFAKNICCDPLSELPFQGSSDEGSKHVFNEKYENTSQNYQHLRALIN